MIASGTQSLDRYEGSAYDGGGNSCRMGNRAFTLTELLVSLGVIAVLAGLLATAISASRKKSTQIICQNNLRQLGVAMHLYVQQNSQYPEGQTQVPSKWMSFGTSLPNSVMDCPQIRGAHYFPNLFGSGGPFRQPSLGLGVSDRAANGTEKFIRESQVLAPTRMIAILDYYYPVFPPLVPLGGPVPKIPHGGGLQSLQCDGHVEWQSIPAISNTSSMTRARWNNDNEPHDETWIKVK